METAFYLVSASLAGLFCFLLNFSYMHMFQLEGYRAKGYLKWLVQYGFGSVLAVIGMAILYAFAYMIRAVLGEIAGWILLAVFAALGVLFICKFRVKDAKKPLVYTSRVKRMLCCEGILLLLLCYLGYLAGGAILAILVALAPLYLIGANTINAPIEALVRRHYLNDAK